MCKFFGADNVKIQGTLIKVRPMWNPIGGIGYMPSISTMVDIVEAFFKRCPCEFEFEKVMIPIVNEYPMFNVGINGGYSGMITLHHSPFF